MDANGLRRAARALTDARRALFITGAGISADSGLPTYRGIGGLYNSGETEEGVPIEVALSGQTFRRDPSLSWKYIHQIEAACRGAGPNDAHRFIAALESRMEVVVLTQNVDGLHDAAGSSDVIAIHGDLHRLRCTRCRWRETLADYSGLDIPPPCPVCRAVARPEVVLFGEMLPRPEILRLERALAGGFDAVFTIGTTSVFPYIAAPVLSAWRWGAPTIEINPGTSEVSHRVDVRLRAGAADALGAIRDLMAADPEVHR